MKYAIIDLGSNSVKMTVFDESLNDLYSETRTIGLTGYVSDFSLLYEGMEKLCISLNCFKDKALSLGCCFNDIHAFATAWLRLISNPQAVINEVYDKTEIKIKLLSGQDEALTTFFGAISDGGIGSDGLFIDIGGASTELTEYRNYSYTSSVSLPFGAFSLYKQFNTNTLLTTSDIAILKKQIKAILDENFSFFKSFDTIAAVGGTIRAFANLYMYEYGDIYYPSNVYSINIGKANNLFERLLLHSPSDIEAINKYFKERKYTVLPGMCAVLEIAKHFGASTLLLSPSNARKGYVLKLKNHN